MKCSRCQHEIPDDSKFCKDCGHALANSAYQEKNLAEVVCERKQVTILFSDMAGYTAMNERLDPEEVKGIMSRVFGQITQVIAKYDGFIERFVGDAVMAIFGIPQVHEDDPVRAIRAAIDIHKLVEALSPEIESKMGRPIAMHSGVNTGLVVTGEVNFDKGTHGLAGDAINLAARLQGLAGTGEILVGESTYKLTQRHFTFKPLPSTKVKGKAKPVTVFKLVSAKTPRLNIDRQVSSAMVGRDQELAKLKLQVMKVINSEGSVVNVVGEAGIGKSRLIAELKNREVMQRVTLLEARSISIGKNLSFHPIIDLLKHWARINEDDSEMQAFDKLERAIRAIHPMEIDEILPFVATLMGMKMRGRHADRVRGIEGEALEKLILKNFRELIIKGSELSPMVIVMEDLHWADDTSLELLQSLFGLAEKHRMLFVNVFRPGYLEKDAAKATAGAHEIIEIQPLANQDSETLINNMLKIKGLPFSIKEQILVRAGGNPFFIEEVVRSLIDDSAVVMGAKGFEVTERIEGVVIPPTINEVLMARIDRLEEQTRELIKIASVIGRSFFDRIIKEVADSIDAVDDRLAYLKDVQFIRDRRRMEELEYLFKHALAQEAAYEATLLQQRKALHLKVARSIEKIFHERVHEFYGMLAHHYSLAEDADKAEEYLTKAGEEALKSSASAEALNYYKAAMELYVRKYGDKIDPAKMADIEENIAFALFHKGHHAEAVLYFKKVLHRLGVKDRSGIGALVVGLCLLLKRLYVPSIIRKKIPKEADLRCFKITRRLGFALGQMDAKEFYVNTLCMGAKAFKYEISDSQMMLNFVAGASGLFSWTGISFTISKKILNYANKVLERNGDNISPYSLHMFRLFYDFLTGQWQCELEEETIEHEIRIGAIIDAAFHFCILGFIYLDKGLLNNTQKIIEKLHKISSDFDDEGVKVIYYYLNALRNLKLLNLDNALLYANKCISLSEKIGHRDRIISSIGLKSQIYILRNDLGKVKALIDEALTLFSNEDLVAPYSKGSILMASFLYSIESLKRAGFPKHGESIKKLKSEASKSGKAVIKNSKKVCSERTRGYLQMGEYYWLTDKQRKAFKWWQKSIQEGERLGARLDLSRTYFVVGKRLLEPSSKHKKLNGIDARGYLEMAKGLFEEMDLQRDLDELYKIMPQAQGVGFQKTHYV